MLHAIVTAADIQDRDGGALLLATLFGMFPFLLKLYADGGYQGPEFQKPKRVLHRPRPDRQTIQSREGLACCRDDGPLNAPGLVEPCADSPRIGRTSI